MSDNPLVAEPVDEEPTPWAGIWIAEDIELIVQGVQSGSWIDGTIGVVATGLDGLALVSDPAGALLQYGIAWLIEHVRPLSEALEWLAGDPAQIAAHAQTSRNVAESLRTEASELRRNVRWDIEEWTGAAADAYRRHAAQRAHTIHTLGTAADGMALITEAAGTLIGTVRLMVRDAIATVVSRLIVYAAELLASLGVATPLVYEQVATLCASWGAKIAQWIKALIDSLRRLGGWIMRLGRDVDDLRGTTGGGSGPRGTTPSGSPDPEHTPRGKRTDAHPTKPTSRGRRRENESADFLARSGFDVEQNPPGKPNGKNPDYKIEGEYFDCYAPSSPSLDQIRGKLSEKVSEGQADRIVLNLSDCPRSLAEIEGILRRKPVAGLQEILVIQDDELIRFYPFGD